jgi:hypothetical protein
MSQQPTAAAGATDQPCKKRKRTKEELAAIARANRAKSRGATVPEGAAWARRGNYEHGLACEVLPMEAEDGAAIAQTVLDWYGYFRPASPITRTLTKICARSDIMLDRCYTFLDTTDGQGREVIQAWEEARTALVADLVALLPTAPSAPASRRSWRRFITSSASPSRPWQHGPMIPGHWPTTAPSSSDHLTSLI